MVNNESIPERTKIIQVIRMKNDTLMLIKLKSKWDVISGSNGRFKAFASLGVHMDDGVAHRRGPSSFIIYGELHHRIGALVPNEDEEVSYAQLYIYNPGVALNTSHKRNSYLNRYVLKVI
ncbi:hypothetical protein GIB67_006521 [Kingdonia uniflora]|uniref:Uncharacterized protein n=1 Tax=Kingdonia uniflora TaxID=39325 RepID=A0A7J7LEJ7_9MAGN|nr:hypothetical protein GIB67_006521 [Kingdonia uniflora]